MKCPKCQHTSSKVLESRPIQVENEIRRRRECNNCGHRFTTFERIEAAPLLVIKKNGNREEFSSEKVLRGVIRSCEKRPVSLEQMNRIVSATKINLENNDDGSHEVSSELIGQGVMAGLKKIDEIAYIRFASVYRQFKDMNEFYSKMKELMDDDSSDKDK